MIAVAIDVFGVIHCKIELFFTERNISQSPIHIFNCTC